MITRLFSAALRGVDAQEVEVEVNARGADKPIVIIVGKTFSCLKAAGNQLFMKIDVD
jgi:hypothetical protein